mgnify:CR=1 FL=1
MTSRVGYRGVAIGSAAALMLAGCSLGTPSQEASTGAAVPATEAPKPELQRFYEQSPSWENCGSPGEDVPAQCTWVEVPIDYDAPESGTTRLWVLKAPAKGGGSSVAATRGALLVNPGGPGGSASQYAQMADFIVSGQVRNNFDIVGFDPRGVGKSEPLECVEPAKVDAMMALDPTPDDQSETDALFASQRGLGDACMQKYPQIINHISTVEAAKDMDVVRSVLGQPKLNYLGKSYGTFLGATYAGQFPERVGNMVLDGALAPDLTNEQVSLGQAKGFESATRAWAQSCVDSGQCPMGDSVDGVLKGLSEFFKKVDAKPLPVTGDARVKQLTEGWATIGVAQAMYTKAYWDTLTGALTSAKAGDGTPLFSLAEEYAGRSDDGTYDSNIMQVISAINCLDRGAERLDPAAMDEVVAKFSAEAPTWGPMMAYSTSACAEWPVEATGKPGKISADGSGPIVVIGTTRDPATPYEWAEQLADQLAEGRLITFEGDGHTAYMSSNRCVDNAVDAYLMNGTVPAEGLTC